MLFYDSNATYVNQNIILQTGDVYVRMPNEHQQKIKRKTSVLSRKELVAIWVNVQEDDERWLTATYQEIADDIKAETGRDMNASAVRLNLMLIMAEKLDTLPSEIARRKKEYRDSVMNLTPAKLRLAMYYYDQGVPVIDLAHRLGFSYNFLRGTISKELKAREQSKETGVMNDIHARKT